MQNLLIATLGQEPQVVTLTLDALLEKGSTIDRVIVIHTDPEYVPVGKALEDLVYEFEVTGTYKGLVLFSHEVITGESGVLKDVATTQEIDEAYSWLYQFFRHHKRSGAHIDLCIAGGRKTLGLFAFSVAQLLFDQDDSVWHLVSDEDLRASRRFHKLPDDEVQLAHIPFIQWSNLPGDLRGEILGEHVHDAMNKQLELKRQDSETKTTHFLNSLTPAEFDLFRLLVQTGGTNTQLAQKLHKSPKTIANQLANIYQKFRVFYEIPQDRIERSQLIAIFGNLT